MQTLLGWPSIRRVISITQAINLQEKNLYLLVSSVSLYKFRGRLFKHLYAHDVPGPRLSKTFKKRSVDERGVLEKILDASNYVVCSL